MTPSSDDGNDGDSRSDGRRPAMAKWGEACVTCATAKAKCIRSVKRPGAKCDRCERLLKDCQEQTHRPRKKRQVKASRTAQIEQRLNGLVNYLKAAGELSDVDLSADTTCIPAESAPRYHRQQSPSDANRPGFASLLNPWAIPEKYNSYAPPTCICRPESGDAPPPPDTDDALLDLYRKEMQRLHPFVIIPENMTAAALRSERPFLMSSIRMVASLRNLRSMRSQMYQLMRHIADHMLIRSEKSLDLLMGIVVILGWYQFHCFMHAQFNNLIALAVTLVGELGLNRPPNIHERTNLFVLKPGELKPRTNEERRAYAGVWFMSSMMSTTFWKTESMRYTYYLQESVKELESQKEYESDTNLVHLVRIQHLADRISQINVRDKSAEEVTTLPTAPFTAYIASFQEELNALEASLSPRLKQDRVFQVYLKSISLRLYEPPAVDAALLNKISESLTSRSAGGLSPLDNMYQSCAALTAWFDNWLSVPISTYYTQSSHIAAQLVFSLTMLGRWAKLATPRTLTDTIPPDPIPPEDPSANWPSAEAYTSGSGTGQDRSASTPAAANNALPSPISVSKASENKQFCSHNGKPDKLRLDGDPAIPTAVAALRLQLETQPGLQIDFQQILHNVGSRFDEASQAFQAASTEPDRKVHNIFSVSAMKLRITRVKLGQWADLIATKTAALRLDEARSQGQSSGGNGMLGQPGGGELDPSRDGASMLGTWMDDQMAIENFYGNTPWTTDLLQGVDPTLWVNGNMEWAGGDMLDVLGVGTQPAES